MTQPHWDRSLSPSEIKRLSPRDKHARALLSLERKVRLVEYAATLDDTDPTRAKVPRDRAKLRRWEVAEQGLWPWADPQFDIPSGKNASLIVRFESAVSRLMNPGRRGRSGLRQDLASERKRTAVLEQQIAALISQNRQLRFDLSRATRGR